MTQNNNTSGFAITAFIFGLINLVAWIVPICGGPLALLGITFAAIGWNSSHRGLAIAGFVLSCLSLLATLVGFLILVALNL